MPNTIKNNIPLIHDFVSHFLPAISVRTLGVGLRLGSGGLHSTFNSNFYMIKL